MSSSDHRHQWRIFLLSLSKQNPPQIRTSFPFLLLLSLPTTSLSNSSRKGDSNNNKRESKKKKKKKNTKGSEKKQKNGKILLTAATVGTTLLVLSGLTLTATAIFLLIATPLLVIWAPILVPMTFLMATGFIFSGGFGIAALSVLTWMYMYATMKQPPGSELLNHVMKVLVQTAKIMKNKAQKYAYQGRNMAQQIAKCVQNMGNSMTLFSENP